MSFSWYPPPTGWIKINVDASISRNKVAGFGGVARDDKGRFLIAFGANILQWDIAKIELMAILYLKNITPEWMFEAQGIIIEGDNSNIIKLLQSAMKTWKVSKYIDDNFTFLLNFNQVLFSFAKRECNKLVDVCANLALKSSFVWEDISFEDIPPSFLLCLKEECDSLRFF
ncbi:Putative ribonuclease H protein [Dendrobium catenatum]|uniref:Ribonuclease H protein n=1 Tax=Dendrobium catenatum TaxID=906689 RepID=A0A2I0VHX3_9ASPA|nr:Putative ribonuclease H protein [Dendrobium catenatum]